MIKEYQYKLEKGSRKYICPNCNKKKFVKYIDTNTGNHLPEKYGRCDSESKCGYHLNPYSDEYGKDKYSNWKYEAPKLKNKSLVEAERTHFDYSEFQKTLTGYENNNFIQTLLRNVPYPIDTPDVSKAIGLYGLGTITGSFMNGATTIPYIDKQGNVRAIQVKQFDENNSTTKTNFLHSILANDLKFKKEPLPKWLDSYDKQDGRVTCLFGEHLLKQYPTNPIALVEAPKTAVYGTLYFGFPDKPDNLLWLAVFNKSSFSFDKLKVLKGREIYVFPDLSKDGATFKEWENKAKEYQSKLAGTRFVFSDLLEKLASEKDKQDGNDLADILIKLDWRQFRKQQPEKPIEIKDLDPIVVSEIEKPQPKRIKETIPKMLTKDTPKSNWISENIRKSQNKWDGQILKLETFFNSIDLPTNEIRLSKCEVITDVQKFISSHFEYVKRYNGNMTFEPYLMRLEKLKNILSVQLKNITT